MLNLRLVFKYAVAVGLLECSSALGITPPITPHSSTMLEQAQGIKGTVMRVTGNQMPTLGDNTPRTQPQPVKTHVWFFSGRIAGKGSRWPISEARKHSNLVGSVESDTKGEFSMELPPGEYTLFAQYDSDLYLNSFLSDGSYRSVQVVDGKMTNLDLLNTEKAAF